jgi:hypothetical protein
VRPNTDNLYRIDIESKEVIHIDLGGETLPGGHGILLDGQILEVVHRGARCDRTGRALGGLRERRSR